MSGRKSRNHLRLERHRAEQEHKGTIQWYAAQRAKEFRARRWMKDEKTGHVLPWAAALITRALKRQRAAA